MGYRENTKTVRLNKKVFYWLEIKKAKMELKNINSVVVLLIKSYIKQQNEKIQ